MATQGGSRGAGRYRIGYRDPDTGSWLEGIATKAGAVFGFYDAETNTWHVFGRRGVGGDWVEASGEGGDILGYFDPKLERWVEGIPSSVAALGLPGSAARGAIRMATGARECPADFPIKGNEPTLTYHVPGSSHYDRTGPEYCFRTVADAEAAGYRLSGDHAARAATEKVERVVEEPARVAVGTKVVEEAARRAPVSAAPPPPPKKGFNWLPWLLGALALGALAWFLGPWRGQGGEEAKVPVAAVASPTVEVTVAAVVATPEATVEATVAPVVVASPEATVEVAMPATPEATVEVAMAATPEATVEVSIDASPATNLVATVTTGATDAVATVATDAGGAVATVTDGATGAVATVTGGATDAMATVTGGAADAAATVTGGATGAVATMAGGATDAAATVTGGASGAVATVTGGAADAAATVTGGASGAMATVATGAAGAAGALAALPSAADLLACKPSLDLTSGMGIVDKLTAADPSFAGLTEVVAADDPDTDLGTPGGPIREFVLKGSNVKAKGVKSGGAIEVFKTVDDAKAQAASLASSGEDVTQIGPVVLRLAGDMSADEMAKVKLGLVKALGC